MGTGSVLDEGVLDLQACWREYICLEDLHIPAVRCSSSPSPRFETCHSKRRFKQHTPRPCDFPLLSHASHHAQSGGVGELGAHVQPGQPQHDPDHAEGDQDSDQSAAWVGWVEVVDEDEGQNVESSCDGVEGSNNATDHSAPRYLGTRDLVDRAWRDVLVQPPPRSVAAAVAAAAQWVKVEARDTVDTVERKDAHGACKVPGSPGSAHTVRVPRSSDHTSWHAIKAAGERKVTLRTRKDTKLRKNRRHLAA